MRGQEGCIIECVWMEGRRCGRTLLEGPDYVIWTRASGWCCVAPSRPGKMLLGVRQHLCVSVLGHVFVRVCVTALRENKAWTKKQYHSMCSREREREGRERNVGRMERENEARMGVYWDVESWLFFHTDVGLLWNAPKIDTRPKMFGMTSWNVK